MTISIFLFALGLVIGQFFANKGHETKGYYKGYQEGYGDGLDDLKRALTHKKEK